MVKTGPAVGAFAVLIAPLVVGAVLAVWALAASPLQSATSVEPVVAQVGSAERDDGFSTTAMLLPATDVVVKAQSSGTVTALSFAVGVPVTSGEVAFMVDGLPIVAYVSQAPLFRDITAGLRGDDVTTAQQLLVDMGYLKAADSVAGPSTQTAIRAFNAAHGRGKNNTTLSIDSLVWIPSASDAPQTLTVHVGDLVEPQTALYATQTGQDSISAGTTAQSEDRMLSVGTVTVTLPAGQTAVSVPDDVAALLTQMGDQTSATAMVTSLEPHQVGTVPATAVVTDATGASCYFTGVDGEAVLVDATSGGFGLVNVDPELIGTPVLVNPRSTRENLACAS